MNKIQTSFYVFFVCMYSYPYVCIQVSVGTLLAFTTVAVSVLILRYVPPNEVPLPLSLQESIESVSSQYGGYIEESDTKLLQDPSVSCENYSQCANEKTEALLDCPLIKKDITQGITTCI